MGRASRRHFLQLAGGAAGAAASGVIARALALPAAGKTGTLQDLEHVVIFMQENRAFDHYFGSLRGVRGFSDPRPLMLPGGASVFQQPRAGGAGALAPFRLDAAATSAQTMGSLDHSWKHSHQRWKWHDAWAAAKGELTMGCFTRADLPFYYALADAFTICDAYHCSIFGPTNPNRMFLWTGTSGLAAGYDGPHVVSNPDDPNETANPANDAPWFKGFRWPTYAERLEAAGVSWRVYQEYDNYGDNALAFFANFRRLDPAAPLFQKARAWVEGANAGNAKSSNGEHLVAAFAKDVAADTLPQVSWIVAPYKLCEHPSAAPGAGEDLTARLIAALAANPAVWAKTALILTYDENDGFFDHMPPLAPPVGDAPGKSTVSLEGELYKGVPVGFGPRVPTLVVSPWTKGGWVNSQLFDHTSVIRLLERRFGVAEPQITPWRRALAGDLTSVFDFAASDAGPIALPDASALPAAAKAQARLPAPRPPAGAAVLLRQEPGQRPARALPYALDAILQLTPEGLGLSIINQGAAGAGFALYPDRAEAGGPWFYAVEAGKSLDDRIAGASASGFALHGPNGFLREARGHDRGLEADCRYVPVRETLEVVVRNEGAAPMLARIANAYAPGDDRVRRLAPGAEMVEAWSIAPMAHWYDVSVTAAEAPGRLRRLAGHIETGRPSHSDPALG